MLKIEKADLLRGGRSVLRDVNLEIHAGSKVGITGSNGAGKSSLMQLIAGELHADAGSVTVPRDLAIAQVAQEMEPSDDCASEYVLNGDAELRRLQLELERAEQAGDGHRQALIHGKLQDIDAYAAPARAAQIMRGLGFQGADESAPVNSFSGGWRMRLHLAQALMCRSDLLLLDEPTNHLDLDAVIWLEGWLRGYEGTLLLISHDREFIDPLVDHIAHVEGGQVQLYSGNYSSFEQHRAVALAQREADYRKQQREIAHMRRFVDRFRYKASKARQAQSRLKALARMELIASAHVDSPFHFEFAQAEHLPTPLVRLEGVSAGYEGRPVIEQVNVSLTPGDRIALLGANGAGKSTLVKVLAGELQTQCGERIAAARLNVGYFAQHRVEQLDPEGSPLDHLQRLAADSGEQQLRDFIGGFGFRAERVKEPVSRLSGGEQARLALAMILYNRPNLLLLDEPTNHLDLEMRHALSVALQEFSGAVVLVSHDRHLLRTVSDRLYLVAERQVTNYDGDLEDYARWLTDMRRSPQPSAPQGTTGGARVRRARRQAKARQRQKLEPLRNEVTRLENELARLGEKRAAIERCLAEPDLYEDDAKDRLKRALADRARLDRAFGEAETRWVVAGEQLERAADDNGEE
jgi:ATP-binding cassette subfamily F protein 3